MDIRNILQRRSDLSTFLVHLTRSSDGDTAQARLGSILKSGKIEARTMMGQAVSLLEKEGLLSASQNCVSFTETPLELVHLLYEDIDGRRCRFEPYGIAIPKKLGRRNAINPVWYVDITSGHDWLTEPLNTLIGEEIEAGRFDTSHIARLAPFIEQMGAGTHSVTGESYRKEFWWEREWRKNGDLDLPGRFICLCPEGEIARFSTIVKTTDYRAAFLDPAWSLEEIIARLAGFLPSDIRLV